ncbi:regulatory LuxR family protein [Herbihabitans rhizosphaerae]|uniref:Regulatory LuxR family protein n=1 Tax=Herbihabitans rhizosphaerae TaxID=1872711 RepID=A0A4Q7KRP4_9PSEU|nr:LuxR family transcriptional regulator [Herbihabitans rhizosphaerae]RZS39235.1 regulatory LuxR family protein [Herbihabitans rhizosphaerae]
MARRSTLTPNGAANSHTGSPSFVGRESELNAVLSTLTKTPSVAMISGEAGVGKTRLVTELLAHPEMVDRRAIVGYCQPIGEPFPYGVVLEAIRKVGDALADCRLSPVVGTLRPYLPEIADLLPAAPGPLGDPRAERHRLFRAVREFLDALGPTVLVTEDLHWSDDGSRRLLRFLMSEPPPNLSMVVTYRGEEIPGGLPLGGAYRPAPGAASTLIELSPLEPDEVHELTTALLGGRPVSTRFTRLLHERTAGLPFVVEELLHTLRPTDETWPLDDLAACDQLDGARVPALLRESMAERISTLSIGATRTVQAAAVVAVPVDGDLLADLAAIPQDRAPRALASALAANVLIETGEGLYEFRHSLAQRAAYQAIPAPERRQLHRRAVMVLGELEPRPLVQLAEHSRKAGALTEWAGYAEAAVDRAIEAGDVVTATDLLCQLLDEPMLPASSVDQLAVKLTQVGANGIDVQTIARTLERLLADRRLSRRLHGEVRLALGVQLLRQAGELETARAHLEMAIKDLEHQPELAGRGMAMLAMVVAGATPVAEHLQWQAKVDEMIKTGTNERTIMTLLASSVATYMLAGDPKAWAMLDGAPKAADTPEVRRELARMQCNIADACAWNGYHVKARRFLEIGSRLAQSSGEIYVLSLSHSTRAHLDWRAGEWDGLAPRCLALADEYREIRSITNEVALVLGLLAVASGSWESAEVRFAETGISQPGDAFAHVAIAARGGLTRMRLCQEDGEGAAQEADRGLDLLRRKGIWTFAAEMAPHLVDAYRAVGRISDARLFVDDFAHGIAGRDAPSAHAALSWCKGILAAHDDDREAASGHLLEASAAYERMPAPYHAALAAERALTCHPSAAAEPAAIDRLFALAQWFQSIGATIDAARCQFALREKGVSYPSRRGRRGYGTELSPREREVARMIAAGQTNREIAKALFLSPRTVERHTASVLKKMGVSSRTELQDDSSRAHLEELVDRPGA